MPLSLSLSKVNKVNAEWNMKYHCTSFVTLLLPTQSNKKKKKNSNYTKWPNIQLDTNETPPYVTMS